VLESRVLDFDTVIVTSMNEEISCRQISEFIYYDVKRELGLPTFKEKMRSIRIILSFATAG
jgi:inactivated superfamily I helicase